MEADRGRTLDLCWEAGLSLGESQANARDVVSLSRRRDFSLPFISSEKW